MGFKHDLSTLKQTKSKDNAAFVIFGKSFTKYVKRIANHDMAWTEVVVVFS